MSSKAQNLQMIQELSDAFGPSGFEDDVLAVIRRWGAGLGDFEEDCLRNLYIQRRGNTGNRPVLMLDAHSDEVGFMIHSIKPGGTLRFVTIGGWSRSALSSADVLVRNARGEYIPGIIAAKPVHFQTAAEKAAGGLPEISSFVIDVGATSYEDAVNNYHIRIGEPVVPATRCRIDEEHGVIFGKAFDCRIGVAALIETMRRLDGLDLPIDVVGVFSSQEEVGERGCKASVRHAKPSIAFVFEGCPADDTFTEPYAIQTAMKKGPMFRFMDVSVICSPRYQRFVLDLAEKKGIPAQASVREGGGNDAAIINGALEGGAPVVVAGVPVRYIHSMNCMTAYDDFEATVQLAVETVKALTPEIIRGF